MQNKQITSVPRLTKVLASLRVCAITLVCVWAPLQTNPLIAQSTPAAPSPQNPSGDPAHAAALSGARVNAAANVASSAVTSASAQAPQAVPLPTPVVASALPTSAPPAPPPVVSPPPIFDPKTELKGGALIDALKQGGYVLFMRHVQSTVGADGALTNIPNWWQNCAIQRNISDLGRAQARKVGFAIRTLNIPLDDIKASQFCRARDTAHTMGLGPIEITEDLNHVLGQRAGFDVNVARFAQLTIKPSRGYNTLLVSHTHGSAKLEERAMSGIQEGEIVVYRPNSVPTTSGAASGIAGTEPIGRISVLDWNIFIPNIDAQLNGQIPGQLPANVPAPASVPSQAQPLAQTTKTAT